MMSLNLRNIGIFILVAIVSKTTAQNATEFLKILRAKVENLEASNKITRDYEPYTEPQLKNNERYDFIIVGSGSAGSAIIRRLSEILQWKILVLEAGGEPDIITDIPFWSPLTIDGTDLNWEFFTEVENNFALGLDNQRMHWPRGKGLGGTSLLNYMIFSRGAKEDYDLWASLGNPGWSYEDVLPFFKKLETCKIENQDTPFRGQKGPIFAEDMYISNAGQVFIEAAKSAGYKSVDYNGRQHKGVSYCQGTTIKGLRCSGERCNIKPVKNRKNLTIRLHSQVTKVIIEDNQACGVEFVKNGKTYKAYANKEVILSAGVINSAHILLLSGVGPREELEKFAIKTIVNLPVGKKIYDHPAYWGLGFTIDQPIQYNVTAALDDEAIIELYNKGSGILQNLGAAESLTFTKTYLAPDDRADIELIFFSGHFSQDREKGLGKIIRISQNVYDSMRKDFEGQNALGCIPVLMHPKSFGRLELQSADPFVYPKLYGGYFTDPKGDDMKTMIAGIREAIRVMLSPPFDKYSIKLVKTPIIGCESKEYDSDSYWECAVRTLASTIFHHTTTCKMGSSDDPEAVVDNRLRVYGIDRLRVADSSVIPISVTGHTNVPSFMVGEKAADIIKTEYLRTK